MYRENYQQILAAAMDPQAQEGTIAYLTEHLKKHLRRQERVLICFQEHKRGNISWLMEQAVTRCGAVPVVWGPDHRWKTLLRMAFSTRATTMIGEPLLALGLTKLAKYYMTPLFIRYFVFSGYPCLDWMSQGILEGLDCQVSGCYSLGISSGVVAGFCCGGPDRVHLRTREYGVDIVDEEGNSLPQGEQGEIMLYPRRRPELRLPTGERGRLLAEPCPCGCEEPVLADIVPGKTEDPDLLPLGVALQSWTSILDCRLRKGESGLEMELVIFPGEKLPPLPTAAKRVLRPFDPESDAPFWYMPLLRIL